MFNELKSAIAGGAGGEGRTAARAAARRPAAAEEAPRADLDPELRRQDSARSNHSDNSFQTAHSTPQLSFIPRQISESYQQLGVPESQAGERKSSVRALQAAQYSALQGRGEAGQGNGAQARPGSGRGKSPR